MPWFERHTSDCCTVTAIGHSSLARPQPGTLAPWTVSAFRLKADATGARAPGRRAEGRVAAEHERPVVAQRGGVAAGPAITAPLQQ